MSAGYRYVIAQGRTRAVRGMGGTIMRFKRSPYQRPAAGERVCHAGDHLHRSDRRTKATGDAIDPRRLRRTGAATSSWAWTGAQPPPPDVACGERDGSP